MKRLGYTSKLYALYLAVLPMVSFYRLPGTSLAIATVLTLIMVLYALVIIFTKKIRVKFTILLPFVLYLLYIMTMSPLLFAILCGAVMIHTFAISTGVVNIQYLRKAIEFISVLAAIVVIMQQVVHITTGIHISPYFGSLFTEGMYDAYGSAVETGMSKVSRMYRPCAFFLEPSHFAQYCMIGLGSCLFAQASNFKKALLISFGILASTSGMGIVIVVAMWAFWGLTIKRAAGSLKTVNNSKIVYQSFGVVVFLFVSYFIMDNINITHDAMVRVTSDSGVESNAITGRLFWWDTYFGNTSLSDYIRGYGLEALPDERYFTGFMKQLYCFGITGVFLLFCFLIRLIFISDNFGRSCCALYMSLIFFSELTGYFHLIFYVGIFLTLYVNHQIIAKNHNVATLHYNYITNRSYLKS